MVYQGFCHYSFLIPSVFKISSKQAFQPNLYDGIGLPGCGYFPHTSIFSGSSRSGHQSGLSYVSESTILDTSIACQLSILASALQYKKLQPKHDSGISITKIALAIYHTAFHDLDCFLNRIIYSLVFKFCHLIQTTVPVTVIFISIFF